MVRVRLSAGLTGMDTPPEIEVDAASVRAALECVVAASPNLRERVFAANGGFATAVFVNGISAKRLGGMDAPLADGDTLAVLPPIAGG